jgi:hypothetical protein
MVMAVAPYAATTGAAMAGLCVRGDNGGSDTRQQKQREENLFHAGCDACLSFAAAYGLF